MSTSTDRVRDHRRRQREGKITAGSDAGSSTKFSVPLLPARVSPAVGGKPVPGAICRFRAHRELWRPVRLLPSHLS
jgi:hypothetical protein